MSPLLYPVVMRIPSRIQALGPAFPGWLESLLIIVLCWQGAGMFWTLFAPSTQNVNLLMPQQSSDKSLVIRDTFLNWYVSENKAATEAPETYRLLGVIAGENGSAVLKTTDGSSIAVRLGDEISPGVRVVALEASQITIERGGVRQIIKLPEKSSATQTANGERPSIPMSTPVYMDPLSPMRQQSALNRGMRDQNPVRSQDGTQGAGVAIASPVSDSGNNIVGESSSSGSAQSSQSASGSTTRQSTTTTQSSVVVPTSSSTTLSTVLLTRGQLQDIIPNTAVPGWDKGVSWSSDGGVRINDASAQAFYTVLQLKAGDLLKQVNDRKILQLGDMSYVFQAFRLKASVDLVLARGTVRYTISNILAPITLSRGIDLLPIVQSGNVSNWTTGLSTATGGGIHVDDANVHPMAKPLQLRTGDILKSINGTPIKDVSDISLFIQTFGQLSTVNLEIVRDGLTLTQRYDINP